MLHLNISIHCSKQSITPPKSLCCAITTLTIGQIIDNYIRFIPPIHSSKDNSLTFSFCFHIISISNVTFVKVKVKLSTPSNFSLSQCFLLIMQRIYIRIITIISIFLALTLQGIWLRNSFYLYKNQLEKSINNLFAKATLEEATSHFSELPKGTKFLGAPRTKKTGTYPEVTYLLESLGTYGITNNINRLDSIFKEMLFEHKIKTDLYIEKIKNGNIVETTRQGNIKRFGIIRTQPIPIKLDNSSNVQAIITIPYYNIFRQMLILIIATAIMMIFIIGCIVYQIKIISKLNKISQIREDFSYAMIHDMKTPLSTIMMVQDMLDSGRLDARPEIKNKYMSIAKSETDHLFALTNKILTISKLENHKLEMNKTEVELTPIIEKLTEKFKAKAQKPVNFIISLQAKTAYADNDYVSEVLSNLIDNAIKYSKESVEIHITTEESERYTILKVRDNGLGISEADQKVIFQKYERAAAAKRSRRNGASGFGLGLNFVDQVIKAHEGRIFVNSTEGEFTEFTIYLPLETPNNKHIR